MKKINWKENKGISLVDVITAMLILTLFVGVISSLYYQLAYHTSAIRMNALAVNYAVKIAEATDKMTYEEVEESLNETLKETYQFPDSIDANITVQKYSDENEGKQDVIKIVTIKVDYEFAKEQRTYEIKKLKIKE